MSWVGLVCVGLVWVGLGVLVGSRQVYIVFIDFLLQTVDVVYSEFFVVLFLGLLVVLSWGWLGFVFGLGLPWLLVLGLGSVWLVLFGGCFGLVGLPWVALGCVGSGCCVGLGPFGLGWLRLVLCPCEVYIVFLHFLLKTVDVVYSEFFVGALLGFLVLVLWGWLGFVFGLGLAWLLVFGFGSVWLVLFGGCFGLAGLPWVVGLCWVGLLCWIGSVWVGLGWGLGVAACRVPLRGLHRVHRLPPQDRGRPLHRLRVLRGCAAWLVGAAFVGVARFCVWLGFALAFGFGVRFRLVGSVWGVLWLGWVAVGCVGLCWVGLLCWVGSVWVGLVAACPVPLRGLHRLLALPPQDRGRCLLRVLRGCASWLLGAGFVGAAWFCVWFGFGLAFGVWLWFRLVGSVWGLLWLGWVAVGCWVVLGWVAVLGWVRLGWVGCGLSCAPARSTSCSCTSSSRPWTLSTPSSSWMRFLASWCWFCGGGSVLCLVWVWLGFWCLALVPFGWFCLGVALAWLGCRGLLGCVGPGCCVGLGPFGLFWVGGRGLLLVVCPCEVYILRPHSRSGFWIFKMLLGSGLWKGELYPCIR